MMLLTTGVAWDMISLTTDIQRPVLSKECYMINKSVIGLIPELENISTPSQSPKKKRCKQKAIV